MKSAMEIKEEIDNKRKEYINSLNFDNLYSEISNRIEKDSLFNSYVIITYEEMFESLGSEVEVELDTYLNTMGNNELNLFTNIILNIFVSKLKSLGYIIVPYYKQLLLIEKPAGIKIYWDPNDVPEGSEKL